MDRRWQVLLVTSVPVAMAFLDLTVVNIAIPSMHRSFPDDSLGGLSWILNAYNVVFAAALVPAGRLADRLGRRRLWYVGVGVFLAGSVLCGAAWNLPVLIAGRVLQAAGGAIIVPASLGLVLPEFGPERRSVATALWTAAGMLGVLLGPPLGGVVISVAGWRWLFLLNLFIGVPAVLAARRLLRERREGPTAPWPDGLGAVLLACCVGALALALVKGTDWGWRSAELVVTALLAAALFPLFLLRSARHPSPVIELSLLRVRSFTVAIVGALLFGVAFYALLLSPVLFLTGRCGYSVLEAGLALTPGPLAATLSAPFAGRLTARSGARGVALTGCLLLGAGAAVLVGWMDPGAGYLTVFLPALLLSGLGIGLVVPALTSAAVAELPQARFATGIAISSCCRHLGGVLGVCAVVVPLAPAGAAAGLHGYRVVWSLVVVACALAAVAAVCLGREPGRGRPAEPAAHPPVVPASEPLREGR